MSSRASVDAAVNEIVAGGFCFKNSVPLWDSKFGDEEWYEKSTGAYLLWNDFVRGRGTGKKHPNAKNTKYKYCLTASMVADLKIAAAIHGLYPAMLSNARFNTRNTALATVKGRIDDVAKLFSLIMIAEGASTGRKFKSLSDFTLTDLKRGIHKFGGRPEALKRGIKLISHQIVQGILSAPLQWTLLDISHAAFDWGHSGDSEPIPTLSDSQFLMLLEHSKRSVSAFLRGMNFQIAEPAVGWENPATQFDADCLKTEVLTEFLCKGISPSEAARRTGIGSKRFALAISDVQNSAMIIVLLLTGMRVSETRNLLDGCLEENYGYWFLKSKVVKGKSKSMPPVEGWLAVPLVRDAYAVLSFLCKQVGGTHLFSTAHKSFRKEGVGPFSAGSLNIKFKRWVARIDTEKVFENHGFSVHQCRESLVDQLAKQEVGLAYISMQLKHVQGQLNSMPNIVTASYGQYRSRLLSSVSARLAVAREDALLQLYGENARLAGPGSKDHRVRIDSFFAGLGLFGEERTKYIRQMARKGVRLMPTSIGHCTNSFVESDGSKKPPCAGDYHCDPKCASHVMTERSLRQVRLRKAHAEDELSKTPVGPHRETWTNLIAKLDLLSKPRGPE